MYLIFRDIWYFLYSSTNREFREKHLEEVLQYYHVQVSHYWNMENFEMSFDQFMVEMNEVKLSIVTLLAMPIIYIMMDPDNNSINSFSKIRRMLKSFVVNLGAEDHEVDNPGWREIRSRYKEIILELYDQGLLRV